MFTTTATTVLALLMTASSSIPFIASFGIFGALVVAMDYAMVITWFPVTVIVYERYFEKGCWAKCLACLPSCRVDQTPPGEPVPERKSVVWIRDKVAPLFFKFRYALFGTGLAIILAMCVTLGLLYQVAEDFPSEPHCAACAAQRCSARLAPAVPALHASLPRSLPARAFSPPPRAHWRLAHAPPLAALRAHRLFPVCAWARRADFYVPSHPFRAYETITTQKFFQSEDWKHQVTVVYGYDPDTPVNRSLNGQLTLDIENEEDLVDNIVKIDFNADMQWKLYDDCFELNRKSKLVDKGVYCLLWDLKRWDEDAWPYAPPPPPCPQPQPLPGAHRRPDPTSARRPPFPCTLPLPHLAPACAGTRRRRTCARRSRSSTSRAATTRRASTRTRRSPASCPRATTGSRSTGSLTT